MISKIPPGSRWKLACALEPPVVEVVTSTEARVRYSGPMGTCEVPREQFEAAFVQVGNLDEELQGGVG